MFKRITVQLVQTTFENTSEDVSNGIKNNIKLLQETKYDIYYILSDFITNVRNPGFSQQRGEV